MKTETIKLEFKEGEQIFLCAPQEMMLNFLTILYTQFDFAEEYFNENGARLMEAESRRGKSQLAEVIEQLTQNELPE